MDKIYVDPTQFNMFLHENYLKFFTDTDDIAVATEYLSDSDMFAKNWMVCGHITFCKSRT